MMQFNTLQSFGRDAFEASFKSFGALSNGAQAAAVEVADYAKLSLEQAGQTVQKLMATRTLDKAVEIQGEFVRTSYETFVAKASKVGALATDTAKEAFAPVETLVSSASRAA